MTQNSCAEDRERIEALFGQFSKDVSAAACALEIEGVSELIPSEKLLSALLEQSSQNCPDSAAQLVRDSKGSLFGFYTAEYFPMPQANNVLVGFIDNLFATESSPETTYIALLQAIQARCPTNVTSLCFVSLANEREKQAAAASLGAKPFCEYPILSIEKARSITTEGGKGLLVSEQNSEQAASEFAALIFEYRLRRTEGDPRNWPYPNADHVTQHEDYLATHLAKPEVVGAKILDGDNLQAVGIGTPIPACLNFSRKFPVALSPQSKFLELDDFYVKLGRNWKQYAPTLLHSLVKEVIDESISHLIFVHNVLDRESREFSRRIGARPAYLFSLLEMD